MVFSKFLRLGWFIVVIHVSGCVTWTGGEKPDLLEASYPKPSQRTSVSFTNRSVIRDSKAKKEIRSSQQPIVQGHFLMKSKFFRTIQALKGSEDLVFRFKTVGYLSEEKFWAKLGDMSYFTLSLLTVGLIPYYKKEPRRLELEVWHQGQKLKQYSVSDHLAKFMWLPALVFWRPQSSVNTWWSHYESNRDKVDENLVRHLMWNVYRDILPKPELPKKKKNKS